jgi:hypothetical protein
MFCKGKPGGRIQRSFVHFPDGAEYAVQENAWMDETCMLAWIEVVLRPWAESAPNDIRPLLILDSYRCHSTERVTDAIHHLGVDCVHIPGGCTALCQPADVGINKPFKVRLQHKWEEYLVENRAVEVRGRIPSPSRETLAAWIIECLNDLDEGTVMNAWNGPGYSYFDEDLEPLAFEEEAVAGNDDMILGEGDDVDGNEFNGDDENGPILIFNA